MATQGDVVPLPQRSSKQSIPTSLLILDPIAYNLSPVTEGGGLSTLVHSSLFDTATLYLDSKSGSGLIMPGYFREFPHSLVGRILVISRILRLGRIGHSFQQKSSSWKYCTSRSRGDMKYSFHYNWSLFLSQYVCICGVSLSSIHYNQLHRIYINQRQKKYA